MMQFPDAFGMSVTVADMDAARRFYMELYPHDHVSDGVFAGINYLSIMRDGETLVNIFQKGEGTVGIAEHADRDAEVADV